MAFLVTSCLQRRICGCTNEQDRLTGSDSSCRMYASEDCCRRLAVLSCVLMWPRIEVQGRAGAAPQRGDALRQRAAAAPIDLTGYWVSVVTQDWRWRMVTPAKGDYESVPITLEAKKVGDAWDPAKDEAAGEQCKAYGAPAIMAVPTRLHITWQDDNTLKVETDAGMQTRLLPLRRLEAPRRTGKLAGRVGRRMGSVRARTRRGADRRLAQGRDEERAARLPAQERRPLQRQARCSPSIGISARNATAISGSPSPVWWTIPNTCACRTSPRCNSRRKPTARNGIPRRVRRDELRRGLCVECRL